MRVTSRGRRTVADALAFVIGLAVWTAILLLVIGIGFYLYSIFGVA